MEVLDRVYKTFLNLDKGFARSNKSRSEYIVDKFGGDIDIGSMIILEAISDLGEVPTMEDIQKLTFVKDTIKKIQISKSVLDNLDSFEDLGRGGTFEEFSAIIKDSYLMGTGIANVSQRELNKENKTAFHYIVTPEGSMFTRLRDCSVVHIYNEYMQRIIEGQLNITGEMKLDSYINKRTASHGEVISIDKARKYVKSRG